MAELRSLISKRAAIKARLTRLQKFLENDDDSHAVSQLKPRLTKLEATWQDFEDIQSQIEEVDPNTTSDGERETFETQYFKLVGEIEVRLVAGNQTVGQRDSNQTPASDHSNNSSQSIHVKLPTLPLPSFNGDYSKWVSFRDKFTSLIHNNASLSDIQRYQYLQSSLTDEAANVIESLGVTAENYEVGWQLLTKRYENKRLIVDDHVTELFRLPTVPKGNAMSMGKLINKVCGHVNSLKKLGISTDSWDVILIHLIKSKLDSTINEQWEDSLKGTEIPKFDEMIAFLMHKVTTMKAISGNAANCQSKLAPKSSSNPKVSFSRSTAHVSTEQPISCPFCQKSHQLPQCPLFLNLTPEQRNVEIKKIRICYNCLKGNHYITKCKAGMCRQCHKRHNTLLHVTAVPNNTTANQTQSQFREGETQPSSTAVVNASTTEIPIQPVTSQSQVLLSTAVVQIKNKYGQMTPCRALLDVGSQSNFITRDLCEKLQLPQSKINIPISGINQAACTVTQCTTVSIQSNFNSCAATLNCLILNKITEHLPTNTFDPNMIRIPPNISLADPHFNQSSQIDLLIGAELFWSLLCVGQVKPGGRHGKLYLQKTQLGWVIGGTVSNNHSQISRTSCHVTVNQQLNTNIERFWKCEEFHSVPSTPEEKECTQHFMQNYSRDATGRFSVRLPIKSNSPQLGFSRSMALKRFYNLERKLMRNPSLKEQYHNFMREYLDLGHMEVVPRQDTMDSANVFYLPHHPVINETSTTTKLRVVFDGSAKTTNGVSLNDRLMVGPTIQPELFVTLLNFRVHLVAFTADIVKMYRQINVHPSDQNYQRIIWRFSPEDDLHTYRLKTVTYGTTSAPFLAIKALQQLAIEEGSDFPTARDTILQNFYVDDLLAGADTIEDAISLRDQITSILAKGGLNLSKWASNHPQLVSSGPALLINFDKSTETKTLGLRWNYQTDSFKYAIKPYTAPTKVTKRNILSNIAQIFDPLGLVGPVIMLAKLLMQHLWAANVGWDESISCELHTKWLTLVNQFLLLNKLEISRCAFPQRGTRIELHGFCDASESGYGACIYVRTIDSQSNIKVTLLCAKSRVAPLKTISLPRLELCGALLLARLADRVHRGLNVQFSKQFYWCDSTIVLSWLVAPSRNWKTFVANRIAEIQSLTNIDSWNHVKSADNPADIISRGMLPEQLITYTMWFDGPPWLHQKVDDIPPFNLVIEGAQLPEQRRVIIASNVIIPDNDLLTKFSSLTKLQRITALCLRFANNAKPKSQKRYGRLTSEELQNATTHLIKLIQTETFSTDISHLSKHNQVGKNSKLLSLNPFIDKQGIIRVGGRLRHGQLSFSQKHPIVLPRHHHVTKLFIRHEHEKHLHAGPQATLAALRRHYWPLSGRNLVRRLIHKCVRCFRVRPVNTQPLMGDLPSARITPGRPFTNCGVDYAGPILLREGRGRGRKTVKSYIALFVCFATKAIHLELVFDLTSESFLNALKRFMARRGQVSNMYSDNATTFVGANRELKELSTLFSSELFKRKVIDPLSNNQINWHFIPARSPHFGGLWEAGIKSTKHHLKRVVGEASLTHDEMYTLLALIESCLNSRPLTPMSNDPNDMSVLTPGHFLIGDSLTAPGEPDLLSHQVNRLSRWQRVQQLQQHFWRRWSLEYVSQLQERTKWKSGGHQQIDIGAIVVIKEDSLPPLQWRIGRVINIHPGKDGVIRAVSIKVTSGVITRATNKVCVLPIDSASEN